MTSLNIQAQKVSSRLPSGIVSDARAEASFLANLLKLVRRPFAWFDPNLKGGHWVAEVIEIELTTGDSVLWLGNNPRRYSLTFFASDFDSYWVSTQRMDNPSEGIGIIAADLRSITLTRADLGGVIEHEWFIISPVFGAVTFRVLEVSKRE